MIIDHTHPEYEARLKLSAADKFNGAFYYSQEIVKNIIPEVQTDRNWVTINIPGVAYDHSVVFIHHNLRPARVYDWLRKYDDLILVCGIPETAEQLGHLGKAIWLPLSVDTEYVKQFRRPKTEYLAFAGRPSKANAFFPPETDYLTAMPREEFLPALAKYKYVYAVGRTAIEAKILGCKVLRYDVRFPDPSRWEVLDNRDAAKILQEKLDELDNQS